jgi:hypothetical protein
MKKNIILWPFFIAFLYFYSEVLGFINVLLNLILEPPFIAFDYTILKALRFFNLVSEPVVKDNLLLKQQFEMNSLLISILYLWFSFYFYKYFLIIIYKILIKIGLYKRLNSLFNLIFNYTNLKQFFNSIEEFIFFCIILVCFILFLIFLFALYYSMFKSELISPIEQYEWLSGLWHGVFVVPRWIVSLFNEKIYCKAPKSTTGYSVCWWISFVFTYLYLYVLTIEIYEYFKEKGGKSRVVKSIKKKYED